MTEAQLSTIVLLTCCSVVFVICSYKALTIKGPDKYLYMVFALLCLLTLILELK